MQNMNNDDLYVDYSNTNLSNMYNIEYIKDYDELDIQIIKSLQKTNKKYSLMNMILDNIKYDELSDEDFDKLLVDISNNNVSNVIDYMKK